MCVTSLQLAVSPSMVPLGRLLVFYVRENGEGVADSLQFAVETFFENQVGRGEPASGAGGQASTVQGVCPWVGCTQLSLDPQRVTARATLPSGINCNTSCIFTGVPPKVPQRGIALIPPRESSPLFCVPTGFQT